MTVSKGHAGPWRLTLGCDRPWGELLPIFGLSCRLILRLTGAALERTVAYRSEGILPARGRVEGFFWQSSRAGIGKGRPRPENVHENTAG